MLGRWRKTSARFWTTLGLVQGRANFDIKVSTAPHSFDVKFSHNLLTIKLITRVMFSSGNKVPDWISQFSDKIESFIAMHNVKGEGERAYPSWCGICQMYYFTISLILHKKNAQIVSFYTQIQTIFSYFVETYNKWIWRIIHRMVFFALISEFV